MPHDPYCFGKSEAEGIIFHWILKEDVEEHTKAMSLDECYSTGAGTHSYHSFIPVRHFRQAGYWMMLISHQHPLSHHKPTITAWTVCQCSY